MVVLRGTSAAKITLPVVSSIANIVLVSLVTITSLASGINNYITRKKLLKDEPVTGIKNFIQNVIHQKPYLNGTFGYTYFDLYIRANRAAIVKDLGMEAGKVKRDKILEILEQSENMHLLSYYQDCAAELYYNQKFFAFKSLQPSANFNDFIESHIAHEVKLDVVRSGFWNTLVISSSLASVAMFFPFAAIPIIAASASIMAVGVVVTSAIALSEGNKVKANTHNVLKLVDQSQDIKTTPALNELSQIITKLEKSAADILSGDVVSSEDKIVNLHSNEAMNNNLPNTRSLNKRINEKKVRPRLGKFSQRVQEERSFADKQLYQPSF